MKEIFKIFVGITTGVMLISPINSLGYIYPDDYVWEYNHSKGSQWESYSNVSIDDIYYDIAFWENDEPTVNLNFAKRKGKVLEIPKSIYFKGKNIKVNSICIDDSEVGEANGKWKMPYEEIVIPNTVQDVSFNHAKLSRLKKIYISKTVRVLTGLSDYPDLEVIIDKENPYIKMKNGAIYSKNGKKLLSLVNSKKKYTVAKGTKSFNLAGVKNIEKVILPGSVKKVSYKAFFKCKNLKTIKLSKKAEVIGKFAFEKCKSLQKIVLPKKTQKIGYGAFLNCTDLSKVKIESEVSAPKIEKNAFKNTADGIRFIVKNQTIADQLSERLKNSGARNAKVVVKG